MIGQHILHQNLREPEIFRLNKLMEKPKRYKHECSTCKYLGQSDHYDLYICNRWPESTVIARYDDEPEDYKSGMYAVGMDPELTIAYKLAQLKGLI